MSKPNDTDLRAHESLEADGRLVRLLYNRFADENPEVVEVINIVDRLLPNHIDRVYFLLGLVGREQGDGWLNALEATMQNLSRLAEDQTRTDKRLATFAPGDTVGVGCHFEVKG
ncbi:MAG: hypothetical protein AAF270_05835 [Pseudomonadota bacterium]